mmetsp:Transcript_7417/g.23002  ORF Transcript_7417/g.23002 Transcript_7417/m.23002 type:complete len:327 (-) Transcript_7417:141-1121(-)
MAHDHDPDDPGVGHAEKDEADVEDHEGVAPGPLAHGAVADEQLGHEEGEEGGLDDKPHDPSGVRAIVDLHFHADHHGIEDDDTSADGIGQRRVDEVFPAHQLQAPAGGVDPAAAEGEAQEEQHLGADRVAATAVHDHDVGQLLPEHRHLLVPRLQDRDLAPVGPPQVVASAALGLAAGRLALLAAHPAEDGVLQEDVAALAAGAGQVLLGLVLALPPAHPAEDRVLQEDGAADALQGRLGRREGLAALLAGVRIGAPVLALREVHGAHREAARLLPRLVLAAVLRLRAAAGDGARGRGGADAAAAARRQGVAAAAEAEARAAGASR